jgi:curved DNA-binding protein CbpA
MTDPLPEDPYEILGVQRGASDRMIAAAYRRLARAHHPDIAGEGATIQMARINAAFDRIRTAARRASHDDSVPRTDGTWSQREDDRPHRDAWRWTPERDGTGGAGPPPGRPSGSVLDFGRHIGWSIGEIARVDPGYLEWLAQRREGRRYLDEIDAALRRAGFRDDQQDRSGHRR